MTKWNKFEMNINKKIKKKEVKAGKIADFLQRRDKEVSILIFLIAIWASGFMAGRGMAFYSLLTVVVGFIFTITLFSMEDWNVRNTSRRPQSSRNKQKK